MRLSSLKVTSLSLPFVLLILISCGPTSSQGFIRRWFNAVQNVITPYKFKPTQAPVLHQAGNQNEFYLFNPVKHVSAISEAPNARFPEGTKKCYGELGCLENTREWIGISRPINLIPADREQVNVSYYYYNRGHKQPTNLQNPSKQQLLDLGFDPQLSTKFIVHGFLENGRAFWPTEMAKALLVNGNYNVFVVNWENGARPPYLQAVANTRVVGLEIAFFLNFLLKEFPQFSLDNVHLLGHSLGSHVCGYAGEKLNGQIAWITGLDPAGPAFKGLPPKVRLDPSDAKFVDVIHTDGNAVVGFGFYQPCGHIDFYMNGGKQQAGCERRKVPVSLDDLGSYTLVALEKVFCDHHRSVYFYLDAIRNSCKFVGHVCDSYESYLQGKCSSCGPDGSGCALLGLEARKFETGGKSMVRLDVSTADEPPYCRMRNYVTQVRVTFPNNSDDYVVGQLKISLEGSKKSFRDVALNPLVDVKSEENNNNLTYMIQGTDDLGDIKQVSLSWKSDIEIIGNLGHHIACVKSLGCNYNINIEGVEVSNMNDMGTAHNETRLFPSTNFCSENANAYTTIPQGSSAKFQKQC